MTEPIYTIDIPDFDKLLDALSDIPEVAEPLLEVAGNLAAESILGIVREYPPATEANQPRAYNSIYKYSRGFDNDWYERGYGMKRVEKDGTITGFKTSRFLGRMWTHAVNILDQGIEIVLGNSAPYAERVQGRRQAWYHRRRGWITLAQAIEDATDSILEAFGEAVDGILEYLSKS